MFKLNINGKDCLCGNDKPLLRFLRDDLHLTAAKDGCSEGACGTCTVIVDGKAVKACIQKVSRFENKKIVTVEGLSQREKAVFEYCFGEAGAVQCGYCIPGMVLCAKALIDQNPDPSTDDVKRAIRGNICRCTGYKKIEEAILMSAKFFREGLPIPPAEKTLKVNSRAIRTDAAEKVNGTGIYADDIYMPGMVYAKALRSRYPRAIINKIDITKASAHPDCVKILLKKDVPNNQIGHLKPDWTVLMGEGDTTRYIGDAVALIAACKPESLDEICSLIDVDYTPLKPMTTPEEALAPDAEPIHEGGNILSEASLVRGDAETAIKNSKYVVTRKYTTPWQEHAFMETECAVAAPEGDGVVVYTGSQSVFDEQHSISSMLKLPAEKVHCHSCLVGGAFGGKEDMSVQHFAALMAYTIKMPVKIKLTRQESINCHTKRHPMEIEITTACDENGILTGMKAKIISDTGAYASLGAPVLHRACTHAAGPYNYQNVDIHGTAVYTNNVVSGAFRGFGVTQSCFASESNINLLADMAGMSPWEIRYKNAIRPGQVLPNGQIADESTALVQCLEAVKEAYESSPYAGIACAFKNSGLGLAVPDTGRCLISIENGKAHIRTSAACTGQGLAQMCLTIACDVTGLSPDEFIVEDPDTVRTPNSGTSTASRQTVFTGEAVRRASEKLKADISTGLSELNGKEYYAEFTPVTDPMTSDKPNPVSHVSYSYGAQAVILDKDGKCIKTTAAFDVGTPVNIQAVEGQIEGGIVMGLGYAFTEEFKSEGGYPKSKLGTLGVLRADAVPETETILVHAQGKIPYSLGAKGIGELCMIPTAPAAAHAYYRLDGKERTSLPMDNTYYRKNKA